MTPAAQDSLLPDPASELNTSAFRLPANLNP